MQHHRKAKDEGFTLIELLIVIIILGILAAIVVFAVGSTRSDSVKATCKTDVKSIQLAAEAYKTKNGAYPVDTGSGGSLVTGQAKLSDATVGGTLKGWPGGTSSSNDDLVFAYAGGASGATYTVTVSGKNFSGSTHVVTDSAPDSGTGTGSASNPYSVDQACTTN